MNEPTLPACETGCQKGLYPCGSGNPGRYNFQTWGTDDLTFLNQNLREKLETVAINITGKHCSQECGEDKLKALDPSVVLKNVGEFRTNLPALSDQCLRCIDDTSTENASLVPGFQQTYLCAACRQNIYNSPTFASQKQLTGDVYNQIANSCCCEGSGRPYVEKKSPLLLIGLIVMGVVILALIITAIVIWRKSRPSRLSITELSELFAKKELADQKMWF